MKNVNNTRKTKLGTRTYFKDANGLWVYVNDVIQFTQGDSVSSGKIIRGKDNRLYFKTGNNLIALEDMTFDSTKDWYKTSFHFRKG